MFSDQTTHAKFDAYANRLPGIRSHMLAIVGTQDRDDSTDKAIDMHRHSAFSKHAADTSKPVPSTSKPVPSADSPVPSTSKPVPSTYTHADLSPRPIPKTPEELAAMALELEQEHYKAGIGMFDRLLSSGDEKVYMPRETLWERVANGDTSELNIAHIQKLSKNTFKPENFHPSLFGHDVDNIDALSSMPFLSNAPVQGRRFYASFYYDQLHNALLNARRTGFTHALIRARQRELSYDNTKAAGRIAFRQGAGLPINWLIRSFTDSSGLGTYIEGQTVDDLARRAAFNRALATGRQDDVDMMRRTQLGIMRDTNRIQALAGTATAIPLMFIPGGGKIALGEALWVTGDNLQREAMLNPDKQNTWQTAAAPYLKMSGDTLSWYGGFQALGNIPKFFGRSPVPPANPNLIPPPAPPLEEGMKSVPTIAATTYALWPSVKQLVTLPFRSWNVTAPAFAEENVHDTWQQTAQSNLPKTLDAQLNSPETRAATIAKIQSFGLDPDNPTDKKKYIQRMSILSAADARFDTTIAPSLARVLYEGKTLDQDQVAKLATGLRDALEDTQAAPGAYMTTLAEQAVGEKKAGETSQQYLERVKEAEDELYSQLKSEISTGGAIDARVFTQLVHGTRRDEMLVAYWRAEHARTSSSGPMDAMWQQGKLAFADKKEKTAFVRDVMKKSEQAKYVVAELASHQLVTLAQDMNDMLRSGQYIPAHFGINEDEPLVSKEIFEELDPSDRTVALSQFVHAASPETLFAASDLDIVKTYIDDNQDANGAKPMQLNEMLKQLKQFTPKARHRIARAITDRFNTEPEFRQRYLGTMLDGLKAAAADDGGSAIADEDIMTMISMLDKKTLVNDLSHKQLEGLRPTIAALVGKAANGKPMPPGMQKQVDEFTDALKERAIADLKKSPFEVAPMYMGLWLASKGHPKLAEALSNPVAFYGTLSLLLIGGAWMLGDAIDDDDDDESSDKSRPGGDNSNSGDRDMVHELMNERNNRQTNTGIDYEQNI